MRRSILSSLVISAAALAAVAAPNLASAEGISVGTPPPRPGSFTSTPAPCVTMYRLASVSITDGEVLVNGKAAPACVRIWSGGTFKLQNNSAAVVDVTLAGATNPMVPTELWNLQPIGAWYAAGSEFSLEVAEFPGFELDIQVF
jgi:hypothetical protein